MRIVRRAGATVLFVLAAAAAFAQAPGPPPGFPPPPQGGVGVFQRVCAQCHASPAADSKAPNPAALAAFAPDAIVNALTNGSMRLQGETLTEAERVQVAEFLTGRTVGSPSAANAGQCASRPPMSTPNAGPAWNGWGAGIANARFQPAKQGGLTAADVPKLTLKWAFGFPGVLSARAQPAVTGGRLFAASETGTVYALDAKTGCTYWTFRAQAGVRSAPNVGPYKTASGSTRYAVYFGDSRANAYAVDAETGQQIWVRKMDDHPGAVVTGAPTLYDGRLYVPVAGIGEEGQGSRPGYECCTFRGSISALDATTGAVVWKTYSIAEEPKPRGKTKDGVQTWGPAGGGIWAAPTIDPKRNAIYIATGNGYSDPPQRTTDAVIALDLKTGKTKWVNQVLPGDVWMMGCQPENPDNPKCPAKQGPDYDFSASPLLTKSARGRDLLVLPQKSGMAYALDPDKDGALVWQYRIGQGSGLGGQWGAASDGQQAYFGVSDFLTQNPGGMHAVNLDTGARAWYTPPPPKLCGTSQQCNAAQGAAVTVIPGVVLSSSADGGLRAYSTKDGSIVWQFDTNREFQTVNGVKAKGGTMDGPGPVVAGGMVYVNSGYGGFVGRAGNVLLAFGIE
jgi:polyvinyl alcohol dehydrogenase (cytochrome)